jgi:hypothetical protein
MRQVSGGHQRRFCELRSIEADDKARSGYLEPLGLGGLISLDHQHGCAQALQHVLGNAALQHAIQTRASMRSHYHQVHVSHVSLFGDPV